MTQLLNELQTFEAISRTRPKEGEANVAEHKPSSSSGSKNKKRKNTQGGLEHNPRKEPKARERRTTPRTRSLKESVSIVGLKVIGRETVTSISLN